MIVRYYIFLQERGEFDIEISIVFDSNKEIIKIKFYFVEEIEVLEILDSYQKFLQYCNYVDICDVFNLVQKLLDENDDFKNYLFQNYFLFIGLFIDFVEVNLFLFKEVSILILLIKCKFIVIFFYILYFFI